ncbi:kynurenine formamidase [Sphingobium sp. OAS761]|uniref:cyclase family protein n=1 Tax=Sphingobium sp. OAS761 TaxID=2817901 RepID=UPI00209EA11F|nr:cyclase family protein [Sphingobium sp. OAS761]MCP1471484.1 kynurenine formamidase [Sphingobium sp. OAS761]
MCQVASAGRHPFPHKALGQRLSNWGRWGAEDERGTLNFITPARIVVAAAEAREGRVFELSIPLGSNGPQTGVANRTNPIHLMSIMPGDLSAPDGMCVADDFIAMPLQSGTQWDGLAHVGYDGLLYNGVSADTITAMSGVARNAIDRALPGVTGRGVLLDIARLHGVEWLPAGHEITPEDLDRACVAQRVEVGSGDILLVRTGWRRKALVEGWGGWLDAEPGLGLACCEWLHRHEIAAVASDNYAVEVQPGQGAYLPVHCVLIRDMGMMLGEIFDLEDLSADCAADGRYSFLLVAPPLRVANGVGSPTSPIAIK